MKKHIKYLLALLVSVCSVPVFAESTGGQGSTFNPQEIIFKHLGDEYGWQIGSFEIPLPVIVRNEAGEWFLFSSSRLRVGQSYEGFYIATGGDYADKVVSQDAAGTIYRPLDFSMTKNVLAVIICALAVLGAVFPLVRWYKKNGFKAPRKGLGVMELLVQMLYVDVIVPVLGKESRRYAPYLLTVFFFIFFSNLLGMIVIFPGGANVMGNMAVTLVLAACTFVIVNVSGTKEYWRDILWPDVPLWLKCPVPMMPVIEIFGLFTKPFALMIRLFANMLGGHLITLVLICLIFLFGEMGKAVLGTTTVFVVFFTLFMNAIDLLVCFIQAYVFMILSTIFISLARVKKEVSK